MSYHNPVMLNECLDLLIQNPDGIYIDCTFGGGGHSRGILEKLSEKGRLYSFDQDSDALENKIDDPRFTLIHQNFAYLKNSLRLYGVKQVDGILADLGVSSHQFDTAERGFSIRFDGKLDMRMNHQNPKSAAEVINEYSQEDLAAVFFYFGELRNSRKIASKIIRARVDNKIETTEALKETLKEFTLRGKENKFYAQVFQALRIEVNEELEVLKSLLESSADVLTTEGRLVVMSYHSLEDRLVKKYIKQGSFDKEPERDEYGNWEAPFHPLQNKVIIASDKEIEQNPRARSAKLRVGIKN